MESDSYESESNSSIHEGDLSERGMLRAEENVEEGSEKYTEVRQSKGFTESMGEEVGGDLRSSVEYQQSESLDHISNSAGKQKNEGFTSKLIEGRDDVRTSQEYSEYAEERENVLRHSQEYSEFSDVRRS